jgi:hypothetical protein
VDDPLFPKYEAAGFAATVTNCPRFEVKKMRNVWLDEEDVKTAWACTVDWYAFPQ